MRSGQIECFKIYLDYYMNAVGVGTQGNRVSSPTSPQPKDFKQYLRRWKGGIADNLTLRRPGSINRACWHRRSSRSQSCAQLASRWAKHKWLIETRRRIHDRWASGSITKLVTRFHSSFTFCTFSKQKRNRQLVSGLMQHRTVRQRPLQWS